MVTRERAPVQRQLLSRRRVGPHGGGACEQWLGREGIPKLNLMLRLDNHGARGFYAALGYEQDDVVVLSRRLTG